MDSSGTTLRARRVRTVIGDLPAWMQATAGAALTAVAVGLLPAAATAAGIVAYAWHNGWPATRLRNVALTVAACCGIAALTSGDPLWMWHDVLTAWELGVNGQWGQAIGHAAGAELLLSTLVAWWWWHRYTKRMESGTEQVAGEKHAKRMRINRQRAAARRSRRELTPLSRDDRVILGHRYEDTYAEVQLGTEQLRQRHQPWIEISMERLRLHLAVVGETGAGKTTLLERLSCGWTEAAWRYYDQQSSQDVAGSGAATGAAHRPLTIFVDAKGGREAGEQARAWADAMEAIGLAPERVGVFPFEQRLNMWQLPPKQLRASLHALAATDHEFYRRLQRELLHLVIDDPKNGAPKSSVDFLQRINVRTLQEAWHGYAMEQQTIEALAQGKGGASPLATDLMLFADLFRSLGGDFDAGRPLGDFDALYISLPGTVDTVVAEAKAAVLIELLAYELATSNRQALFVLDEFSAVSGETAGAVTNLVERLRSMGGSVIVSSQSYQGLARTEDERQRLLNAMGGGMLVMRTQGVEPLAMRTGTRKVGEVGRKILGGEYADEGTLRRQDSFLLDPNRVRQMAPHHVAYVLPEQVQWGVVTPLEPTKRLPSRTIVGSPRRALPTAGDAVPFLQLQADQRSTLEEQLPGWSA